MAFGLFLEGVFEGGGCVLLMILYQNLGIFIQRIFKISVVIKEKFTKRDQTVALLLGLKIKKKR